MQKIVANFLVLLCLVWVGFVFLYFKTPDPAGIDEQKIEFQAKVVDHPDIRDERTILIVENSNIDSHIRVTTKNKDNYKYGDVLKISGTIAEAQDFTEDFGWRNYLAKEGIYYVMYSAEVQKIQDSGFNIKKYLGALKNKLSSGIDNALLPPHSSLYKAMLLREKNDISQAQTLAFQKAGLSHILAISGLHIAVITTILFLALLGLGMWRNYAGYLALFILTLYILMIGAPASAVRAGIMAGAVVLAETLGRPRASWRALVYAAAIMLAFNPLLARYDIGFQLSFLAVFGIILFYKHLEKFFYYIKKRVVKLILKRDITKDMPVATYMVEAKFGFISILAVTLSAQALTFPLIIYHFGVFSVWSPLTNLLVLPILPLALTSGMISAVFGALNFLPTVFAAPAWLFSSYIWYAVNLFGI